MRDACDAHLLRAIVGHGESHAQFLRAGAVPPRNEHLVGIGHEVLATVPGSALLERHARGGTVEIELATIVGHRRAVGFTLDDEIAEALVVAVVVHLAAQLLRDVFGFELRAVGELFADRPHEPGLRFGRQPEVVAALGSRPASPQGFLGDLQAFGIDAAEHHGADASVADGQRFLFPIGGGLVVPEEIGVLGVRERCECEQASDGS